MRASTIEVLRSNYVRTARAKGLSSSRMFFVHVLPAAIMPVVSFLGPATAAILTGSVVIEQVFGIPGSGPVLRQWRAQSRLHAGARHHAVLRHHHHLLQSDRGYSLWLARPAGDLLMLRAQAQQAGKGRGRQQPRPRCHAPAAGQQGGHGVDHRARADRADGDRRALADAQQLFQPGLRLDLDRADAGARPYLRHRQRRPRPVRAHAGRRAHLAAWWAW